MHCLFILSTDRKSVGYRLGWIPRIIRGHKYCYLNTDWWVIDDIQREHKLNTNTENTSLIRIVTHLTAKQTRDLWRRECDPFQRVGSCTIEYGLSNSALVTRHLLLSAQPVPRDSAPAAHAHRYSDLLARHSRHPRCWLGKVLPDFRQRSLWQKLGLGEWTPHVAYVNCPLAWGWEPAGL